MGTKILVGLFAFLVITFGVMWIGRKTALAAEGPQIRPPNRPRRTSPPKNTFTAAGSTGGCLVGLVLGPAGCAAGGAAGGAAGAWADGGGALPEPVIRQGEKVVNGAKSVGRKTKKGAKRACRFVSFGKLC